MKSLNMNQRSRLFQEDTSTTVKHTPETTNPNLKRNLLDQQKNRETHSTFLPPT